MSGTGEATTRRRSGVSRLLVAAGVVASVSVLLLLSEFWTWVNSAEDSCNLQPDLGGMDGQPGWSWWPPGPTCTYQVQSPRSDATLTLTVGSSVFVWTTVLLLMTVAALTFALRRARRMA
ncbi:MAG: hypothetical protein WCI29_12765 [Actinomycetes bacterium]